MTYCQRFWVPPQGSDHSSPAPDQSYCDSQRRLFSSIVGITHPFQNCQFHSTTVIVETCAQLVFNYLPLLRTKPIGQSSPDPKFVFFTLNQCPHIRAGPCVWVDKQNM